jgi:hypothetical protein
MEGMANPAKLLKCANKLMQVISSYPSVYIATDYPLQGKQRSGTFHAANHHHREALEILQNSPNVRVSNVSVADTGAVGIVVMKTF